jgi:hypothetical protein
MLCTAHSSVSSGLSALQTTTRSSLLVVLKKQPNVDACHMPVLTAKCQSVVVVICYQHLQSLISSHACSCYASVLVFNANCLVDALSLPILDLFLMASWISYYLLPEQCLALHSGTMDGGSCTWVRSWACHAGPCALSPPCYAAAESTEQFPQHCPDQTAWSAQAQLSSPYIADRLGMYPSLTCMLVQRLKPL